jgi:rhodanese-related sulfurtransferase
MNGPFDLSFLQAPSAQRDNPLVEIHRGTQRRLSVFPSAPANEMPSAPSAAPAPAAPANRLVGALAPIVTALAGALRATDVPRMLGGLTNAGAPALLHSVEGQTPLPLLQALATLIGPNIYQATLNELGEKTREVSTSELVRILGQKSAVLFDARTALEYAIGHIPGAINAAPKPGTPMSQYVSDAAEIGRIVPNKSAPVIVYCNGPFCGKSRRLGEDLVNAGHTNVRRYQLGTPVWRALVGPMVIEPAGIRYIQQRDDTAAFIDARAPEEFASGSLSAARNIPLSDVIEAKDDGRLPMDDFNTRVIVFGRDGAQSNAVAEALAHNGFINVKYFDGTFSGLLTALRQAETSFGRGISLHS